MRFKTLFYLVPRLGKCVQAIKWMRNQEVLTTREHLRLCGEWLLYSQTVSQIGGYAASYGLVTGLRRAYIETTGYIIPTMFDLAEFFGEPKYRDSARKAGEWLLTVQQEDGSFTDIDDFQPQVFDTGQVLLGLNRLYRETSDTRYLAAGRRAGDWLVKVQDKDGDWTKMAYYRGRPCTYLTRVAAAALELAQLTGEAKYRDCAVKNLRWTSSRQQANGFLLNAELCPNSDPVLHTMVYVLEGFLMAYQLTHEREWLDVLLRGAEPLKEANLGRDLVLRSQYNAGFNVTNPEKCIPGLAQWAGVCLHLCEITKNTGWLEAAQLSIYYLKSKQLRGEGILHGALPASVPLWGYYHPMMFPNWTVKFFADALLLYSKYNLQVWQEQETWVKKCFELQLDGGGWNRCSERLEALDEIILCEIEESVRRHAPEKPRVLDIGCGAGRYVSALRRRNPGWCVEGIDPCAQGSDGLHRGSGYAIPAEEEAYDVAYAYITLQHIADNSRVFAEIHRVLKPGGLLILCDRSPVCARGVLKPLHEIRGRWMYPWDSPFRERWQTAAGWRRLLKQSGFNPHYSRGIQHPGDRGIRRLIPTNRFVFVAASREGKSRSVYTSPVPGWTPPRWTARWGLEQWNRVIAVFNLRLDTLTTATIERRRLEAVEERGGFTNAVFMLPPAFLESAHEKLLAQLPQFQKRFDTFGHAETNDVAYQFNNHFFSSPDAEMLYTVIRHFKPRRVLEIGCGNSTRITRQAILDGRFPCHLTSIDPQPREDIAHLADTFIRTRIESLDAAELAGSLRAGDVLFIDTSHEVRVANDVAFIYCCIIPRLRPGVIVHIHDIFLPYDYPRHWVLDLNCATWGEQYLVHAMLCQDSNWKVLWPGYYLQRTLSDFTCRFPHIGQSMAQSLWIQKTG